MQYMFYVFEQIWTGYFLQKKKKNTMKTNKKQTYKAETINQKVIYTFRLVQHSLSRACTIFEFILWVYDH